MGRASTKEPIWELKHPFQTRQEVEEKLKDNKELQENEIKKLDDIWEEIKQRIEGKDYYVAFQLMKHMYLSSYTVIRFLAAEENKKLETQIKKAFDENFNYDDFIKREG